MALPCKCQLSYSKAEKHQSAFIPSVKSSKQLSLASQPKGSVQPMFPHYGTTLKSRNLKQQGTEPIEFSGHIPGVPFVARVATLDRSGDRVKDAGLKSLKLLGPLSSARPDVETLITDWFGFLLQHYLEEVSGKVRLHKAQ